MKSTAFCFNAGAVTRWGAAGLAGVWAEANTRASIFDALARKETFATSGPRMRVRLFAGWDLEPADLDDMVARGYQRGVPMGGDLSAAPEAGKPTFLVRAQKDPNEAPLERLQIVKGWLEDGVPHERVIDVACAGAAPIDPLTRRCKLPPVDTGTAPCTGGPGAGSLATHWRDDEFDPAQRAFYYIRVLQVSTCRWSTYDAQALGIELPDGVPRMLQERAITSPVWYDPPSV